MSESDSPEGADKKSQYPYHRRFVRYSIRLWIQVHVDEEYDAWTQNISQDGVCFEVARQLPEGQDVKLLIHLREKPPAGPLRCDCRIVWNEKVNGGYRHGGQFVEFDDAHDERLKAYLNKRS